MALHRLTHSSKTTHIRITVLGIVTLLSDSYVGLLGFVYLRNKQGTEYCKKTKHNGTHQQQLTSRVFIFVLSLIIVRFIPRYVPILLTTVSRILACWDDWVLIALSYDCIDLFVL